MDEQQHLKIHVRKILFSRDLIFMMVQIEVGVNVCIKFYSDLHKSNDMPFFIKHYKQKFVNLLKTDLIEIEVTNLKDCVGVTNHELPNTLYLKKIG